MLKAYCGFLKDDKKVKQSSSGGLATSMAEKLIKENNVVYGVAYSSDFKDVEYIRADSLDNINRLKGAKYVKAIVKKDLLEKMKFDLQNGKKVLFIGLPCDIDVVKRYVQKHNIDDTKLICVDLICHGASFSDFAKEYIQKLEQKYKSKVVDFSVRYKNPYWKPPYLMAKFENNQKHIEKFYDTDYGIAFMMMSRNICYNCKNKGDNYKSDITIGDFWGVQEGEIGYNIYGSSVAFVHTQRGDEFIKSLTDFNLFETDAQKAIKANPRYDSSIKKTPQSEQFKANFKKKGLSYAVSKHLSLKQKVVRKIPKKILMIIQK